MQSWVGEYRQCGEKKKITCIYGWMSTFDRDKWDLMSQLCKDKACVS